jgi:FkbM family methyltransferase
MSSRVRAGKAALRRSARSSIISLGREDQARAVQRRLREARSAFNVELRRHLRDEHAMQAILAATLRNDSNAIDIGANEGSVLASILRVAPAGRHIAYEPIPQLHARLVEQFPSVDVRCEALYDERGTASFTHVLDASTRSGLRQRADLDERTTRVQKLTVPTARLDEVLADDYVPTLIKIDVEGAELNVLRGAVETLQRHRPLVVFEHGVGGADLYDALSTELFDLLDGCGLRIFDLDGEGPYSRERFEATFTEPVWNFLAAPRA